MAGITIEIKADNISSVYSAIMKKNTEMSQQLISLQRDLVNIAKRWVQNKAPRKTGKLKSAVASVTTSTGGMVFVQKGIAPYFEYVVDGTSKRTIYPKNKQALYWGGASHPVKKVEHPGTKANPFIDKAADAMESQVEARVNKFAEWMGAL